MIPSTSNREQAEEQAGRHFRRGSRRAVLGRFTKRVNAWVRQCCSVAGRKAIGFAACFSEELSGQLPGERVPEGTAGDDKGQRSRVWLGPREVEISRIVGSVGRCQEFDEDFRPLKRSLGSRWKSVYRALAGGEVLPAVKLFKLGERYFVEDGNHRVSVARDRGAQMIDADVTEVTAVSVIPLCETSTTVGDTSTTGASDYEQGLPKARS